MSLGLVWCARCSLVFEPVHQVDAGDASGSAYALLTTWASFAEISDVCKWREAWRFRPLPQQVKEAVESGSRQKVIDVLKELHSETSGVVGPQELRPTSQFGAGLQTQFATWLAQSSDDSSWLRTSAISSQLRAKGGKRMMVEVPAMVPPLPESLCRDSRYSLLWRKTWRSKESGHITLKEARVALSSVRRTCRTASLHGHVKLTLTDNLSCLAAFERGRACDFRLNQLCRSAAACGLGCGVRWRLRHVEAKRNPAGRGSRFDKLMQGMPFDRGKPWKPKEMGPISSTVPSTPSSQCGVCLSTVKRDTANAALGRRGTMCDEVPVRTDVPKTNNTNLSQSSLLSEVLKKTERPKQLRGNANVQSEDARPQESGCTPSSSSNSTHFRRSGAFLEIFAGSCRLTAALQQFGCAVFTPMEIKHGGHFDLRRRSTQLTVLAWLRSGAIAYVHLGTPCTVFSRARHFIKHVERARERERVGLEMALFSAEVIHTCNRYNVHWSLENPRFSRLFEVPGLHALLQRPTTTVVDVDFCRFGEPYKKPTRIYTSIPELKSLGRLCIHKKHQVVLRGSEVRLIDGVKRSVPKTQAAGAYPLELSKQWAQIGALFLDVASRDSELLDIQWRHELLQCCAKRQLPEESIQTSSPKLFHVQKLGQAKDLIVYGQHSSQEAREKRHRLSKLWRGKEDCSFQSLGIETQTSKTPTTQSLEG